MVTLEILQAEAATCTKCELHKNRIKSVFAKGNPKAKLVFQAEAGGAEENEQGIPFVGKAGKLLDKMIEAMGMTLDDVYICNTVKCRPPNNRKPLPEEIEACRPYLTQQLKLVNPEVIVTLGATATEALLGPGEGITKRRGKWAEYSGIKVMPTFHPAYLLRNPPAKEVVAQDLKLVLNYLN